MTVAERIKKSFDDKGITAYKAEKDIGIGRSLLGKYMSGESEPSVSNIERIADYLSVDLNWLISGKGFMSESYNRSFNDTKQRQEIAESPSGYGLGLKPHIDSAYAFCGPQNGFNESIMKYDCEEISLPFVPQYDFSIRASGDSMLNRGKSGKSIHNQDIVACRYVKSRSHIKWGEVYALATTDGIVVKKLMPSEKENHIRCMSFNEEDGYLPYDLFVDEITDWAIVVGVVSVKQW